ncbi:helicase associated domain-containing protein [Kitasatospora sp. NPDC005748]|uniref:helicase associated domain-containing protein n=1 Tax=Kitasatospora sp. NPDC005748 TaxID=3157063 RepID=UPI0033FB3C50
MAAKAVVEAKPTVSRTDRFARGMAALAKFVERERHPRVPCPRKEPVETVEDGPGGEEQVVVPHVALGTWLNNQKPRRAKLTPGQLTQGREGRGRPGDLGGNPSPKAWRIGGGGEQPLGTAWSAGASWTLHWPRVRVTL